MRTVLVKDGRVAKAYQNKTPEELESALGTQGGEYLVNETATLGSQWPAVEAGPEPEPQPLTVAQVTAELDAIREQLISDYIGQWGEASRRDMWPELDTETRELASVADAALALPEKYPAMTGFLKGSGVADPTAQEIHATASALRGYKSNHVQLLRSSEITRATLIAKFQGLTEAEQLAWDSTDEWEATHGA